MSKLLQSTKFRIVSLFLFFIAIFFFRQIFLGEVIYCCDNFLMNVPTKVFFIRELMAGRFPLWNPYIFSGTPFFADINLGLLHPFNLLYALLPPFRALTAGMFLDILVALIGMYMLVRALGVPRTGSIVSAIVFGFSGTLIFYTNNISLLQTAVLAPWVLWGFVRYIRTPEFKSFVILVALSVLQVFAGHPQLTYYTWLVAVAYVLAYPMNWRGKFTLTVPIALFVFLFSAVQLVPFLEFVKLSTRVGRGLDYSTFLSLHPLSFIRFVIPNIVGVFSQGTAWAREGTVLGYVGVLPLVFAILAFRKRGITRFFGAVAVVSFILALGSYTPIYGIVSRVIPGMRLFRLPQQFLFVYTLALSVLAGFGAEMVISEKRRPTFTAKLTRIGIIGILFSIFILLISGVAGDWISSQSLITGTRVVEKLRSFPKEFLTTIVRLIGQNILVTSAILLALTRGFARWRYKPRAKAMLLTALVFIELFLYSRNNLISIAHDRVEKWIETSQSSIAQLPDYDWKVHRMYVQKDTYFYPGPKQFGVFDLDREALWQATIARPNLNMIYGIPSVDGYSSLVYKPYQDFFQKIQADPTGVDVGDFASGKMDLLGVRYIVTPTNLALPESAKRFEQTLSNQYLTVYRNTTPLSRIFFQTPQRFSGGTIDTRFYTPNAVFLDMSISEPGQIIFTDVYYPGWYVYVDGEPAEMKTYQDIFKSVDVTAGTHTVLFVFQPRSLYIGAILSTIGVTIIVIFLMFRRGEKRVSNIR